MRQGTFANITLELEYARRVNWSLLHAGVPFVFRFCAKTPPGEARGLAVEFSVYGNRDNTPYLNRTSVHVTEEDVTAGRDLASVIHADLVHQWLKRQAWGMGENVEMATFGLRLSDGRAISCPVEVSPPTYWFRAIDDKGLSTDRLPTFRATISLGDPHPVPVLTDDAYDCAGKAAYPPLAAAIATFIDKNDPYVRQDGQEDDLGRRIAEYVRVLCDNKPPGLSDVLKSFYRAVLEKRNLRHVDFLHEYTVGEQAVRVLKSHRERGALCLDLVGLGCEVLEAWDYRPLFILTNRGQHAVLGAWSSGKEFPGGLPVCTDASSFAAMVQKDDLTILDVTKALFQIPYNETSRDSPIPFQPGAIHASGFVYAVDIAVARGWPRSAPTFRILPLHRPRAVAEWVVPYLEKKLSADLQSQRAHTALPPKAQTGSPGEIGDADRLELDLEHLDDPDRLFIPAKCHVPAQARDVTLDLTSPRFWPPDYVSRPEGKLALAVLAHGGSGKSYLCRGLAKAIAASYLNGSAPGAPVPIFYPLRQFVRGANLLDTLARHVGCDRPEDLAHAVNHVPLLFILDALDESDFGRAASSPKDYEELFRPLISLPNTSVLLTGRPAMFPGAPDRFLPTGFTIAYLKDWDANDDLKKFLEECESRKGIEFEGGSATFYDTVFGPGGSENLRDLAKTPLFARMIVQTREIIEREVRRGVKQFDELDLYRKYTRHCFHRKWTLIDEDVAEPAHKEIALSMYITGRDALPADDITTDLSVYLKRYGIGVWRRFSDYGCVVYGLLVPEGEKTFRFGHLSFEHYFLAERLAEELRASLAPAAQPGIIAFSTLFGAAQLAQGAIAFIGQILRSDASLQHQLGEKLKNVPAKSRKLLLSSKVAARPTVAPRGDEGEVAFRNLVLMYLSGGGRSPPQDLSSLPDRPLDFSKVDLSQTILSGCNLSNTRLRGAVLRSADLRECILVRADLREADVTNALFSGADFRGCQLSHIRVSDEASLPCLDRAKNLDAVRLEPDDHATAILLDRCKRASKDERHS